jgi:uncharacterized protein YbjT (DUF2867 family)
LKILLTGGTGYIGKRLLPLLLQSGHQVICTVRDKNRFNVPLSFIDNIKVIETDFADVSSVNAIPSDVDVAYYLIHSMSHEKDYEEIEKDCANNFRNALEKTSVDQVIYLGGIINEEILSKHLASRKAVEEELAKGRYNFTSLRSGIIIGSGSASFEIIRDLVEKLPIMVAPKWLKTKCQPISISDVLKFLTGVLKNPITYNQNFDIGGPKVLSYKQMLLEFAGERKLWRKIFVVPVLTPKLSSYWLYFITSTSYRLARSLVGSMKVNVICRNNDLTKILKIKPLSYLQSLKLAFRKIESNDVISSWKDSFSNGQINSKISDFINVPFHGCFIDKRELSIENKSRTLDRIWQIGGNTGWYYANWLWRLRGILDKIFGGVGLRRGRTNPIEIYTGDTLDFWRVLYANKTEGRLLLFAEMKLPGDAWLEFKVSNNQLIQTATFRPKGLWGRLYWFSVYPFHGILFSGMIKELNK